MATFGKTAIGGTNANISQGFKVGSKFTLADNNISVSKLTMYLDGSGGGAGTQNIKGIIYSDSAGAPNARLGITNAYVITAGDGAAWVDLTFASSVSIAASGTYWLCWIADATDAVGRYRYDTVASAGVFNSNSYGAGPSDPFGAPTSEGVERSIYATYTITTVFVPKILGYQIT